MKITAIIFSMLMVGCGLHQASINQQYNIKTNELYDKYSSAIQALEIKRQESLVRISCATGDAAIKNCGLLADELYSKQFKEKFISEICNNIVNDLCEDKYRTMYLARITERYWNASKEMVVDYCRAHPIECKDLEGIEIAYLAFHNASINSTIDNNKDILKREYERIRNVINSNRLVAQEEARRAEAASWSQALRSIGEGLQKNGQKQVNCTSYQIGNSVQSDCTVR